MWRNELDLTFHIQYLSCIKTFLLIYLCLLWEEFPGNGEVTEWSKVLAWKVSVPQKGTGGSNPFLSASFENFN